jgi:hypothetical protein
MNTILSIIHLQLPAFVIWNKETNFQSNLEEGGRKMSHGELNEYERISINPARDESLYEIYFYLML